MSKASANRLLVFAAALLFSTGGAAIKACSLSSWAVAGFRSGIAAATLGLLLPGARRGWTWRTIAIGLAYAATLVLFVLANKTTTSANAIFLQSTAPLYLLLLGPFVLREPVRRVDLAVISAVATGAVLLLFGSQSAAATAPDPARGNLLGAVSGVTWALTIAGMRWLGKYSPNPDSAAATVIAGNLIAFAACLPMAVPIRHASVTDVGVLLYLGVFQIALAYSFLTRSLREVPALEAATLLLIEPVLNPIWTWVVHGEKPGALALIGGILIIGAAFGGTVWQVRRAPLRYVG
ncbi:MAG TPA: DMT family transporter [Bryobacteraceae bacterium]|nr:DMT family transporter [Bryobacteraceae bacterium]